MVVTNHFDATWRFRPRRVERVRVKAVIMPLRTVSVCSLVIKSRVYASVTSRNPQGSLQVCYHTDWTCKTRSNSTLKVWESVTIHGDVANNVPPLTSGVHMALEVQQSACYFKVYDVNMRGLLKSLEYCSCFGCWLCCLLHNVWNRPVNTVARLCSRGFSLTDREDQAILCTWVAGCQCVGVVVCVCVCLVCFLVFKCNLYALLPPWKCACVT